MSTSELSPTFSFGGQGGGQRSRAYLRQQVFEMVSKCNQMTPVGRICKAAAMVARHVAMVMTVLYSLVDVVGDDGEESEGCVADYRHLTLKSHDSHVIVTCYLCLGTHIQDTNIDASTPQFKPRGPLAA